MAQPEMDDVGLGVPRTIFGSTGSKWVALLVDTLGRLISKITGFDPVPSSPVAETDTVAGVATGAWTTIGSYTVTTGKTLYVTDFYLTDVTGTAGTGFMARLTIGGTDKIYIVEISGNSVKEHLRTPLKATTAQVVTLDVYQFAGGARSYGATIIGFEV